MNNGSSLRENTGCRQKSRKEGRDSHRSKIKAKMVGGKIGEYRDNSYTVACPLLSDCRISRQISITICRKSIAVKPNRKRFEAGTKSLPTLRGYRNVNHFRTRESFRLF